MNSPPTPRILVWNAERKSPRGSVGSRIPTFLARHAPDIVLLTEGEVDLMPPGGHTMTARPLPFAHLRPNERRVLAWSREPWTAVEDYQAYEAADPDHPADPSEILPGMPYERLTAVFAPPWSIVTAGLTLASPKGPAHPDKPLIDHLAVNAPLTATAIEGFGNLDHDGQRLSDHTGCVVTLARA